MESILVIQVLEIENGKQISYQGNLVGGPPVIGGIKSPVRLIVKVFCNGAS